MSLKSKFYSQPASYDHPLEIKGLYKRYDKKSEDAITDINFYAESGKILGLLGPNGAGKSTTLKCVTGILPFEQGEIKICGYSIRDDGLNAKRHFSFVTDNHSVFVKMTGMQYLDFMSDIYNVPRNLRDIRIAELQKIFALGKPINSLISSYSHGMKQKICMMGSLMHNPDVWILDEPMLGLDPTTQHAVVEFMRGYVAHGKTIIFSSHNLDIVKRICDTAVIIKDGKIVKFASVNQIEAEGGLEKYYYNVDGVPEE